MTTLLSINLLLFLIGPPQRSLEDLLDRAADNARRYTDAMRNLTAEEIRETELFDRNGRTDRRRRTVADMVVHNAGGQTLAEFRHVREVDGRPVKGAERRLDELLRNLADAGSIVRELELVDRESSRHDLEEMRMKGMALNQAWPLEDPRFRQAAAFRIVGSEIMAGRDTVIVAYELPSGVPESWHAAGISDRIKPSRVFVRGRIWIGEDTAEIWRYEAETLVEEASQAAPVVWDRMEFRYTPSSFGVPTPERIMWESFGHVSREESGLQLSLKGRLTVRFGTFKRFGAEVTVAPLNAR